LVDTYILALNAGTSQKMIEATYSHVTVDQFKGSSGPRKHKRIADVQPVVVV